MSGGIISRCVNYSIVFVCLLCTFRDDRHSKNMVRICQCTVSHVSSPSRISAGTESVNVCRSLTDFTEPQILRAAE